MNSIKVIRIAGTSYSGSTMLDLMLSNGDEGFSCGEINALFRPYRKHHFTPVCDCRNSDCDIWDRVKKAGESQLWYILPQLKADKKWFVDSSKDLIWLYDQNRLSLPRNYIPVNVLVWKSPLEFALSCWKRNKLNNWYDAYTSYHERYFSIMDQWYSVKYSDLVNNPQEKLKSICEAIGINYFPGKENYWEGDHHTLFGSHSAKLHLYNKNDSTYSEIVEARSIHKEKVPAEETDEVKYHKQIYGVDNKRFDILPEKDRIIALEDEKLIAIHSVLLNTEVDNINVDRNIPYNLNDVSMPRKGWYLGGKIKRLFRTAVCRLF